MLHHPGYPQVHEILTDLREQELMRRARTRIAAAPQPRSERMLPGRRLRLLFWQPEERPARSAVQPKRGRAREVAG